MHSKDEIKRAIAKAEKCLAMAKRGSQNEAEIGRKQADALMRKYGLVADKDGNVYLKLPPMTPKQPTISDKLSNALERIDLNSKREVAQKYAAKGYYQVEKKVREFPYEEVSDRIAKHAQKAKALIKQFHWY